MKWANAPQGLTTVYRVEGAVNQRLLIDAAGNVWVQDRNMLFLNFGDAARASLSKLSQSRNRCIVLTVDQGRERTRVIHLRQRAAQTLEGILPKAERSHILKVHQDAQRLLRPLLVANPFAHVLGFWDHASVPIFRRLGVKSAFEGCTRGGARGAELRQHLPEVERQGPKCS